MDKSANKGKRDPASFEDRLKRLEDIVNELEKGDVPLKETIRLFEEGRDLTRQLTRELNEAERKIELLVKDAEGRLATEPFPEPEPDSAGES